MKMLLPNRLMRLTMGPASHRKLTRPWLERHPKKNSRSNLSQSRRRKNRQPPRLKRDAAWQIGSRASSVDREGQIARPLKKDPELDQHRSQEAKTGRKEALQRAAAPSRPKSQEDRTTGPGSSKAASSRTGRNRNRVGEASRVIIKSKIETADVDEITMITKQEPEAWETPQKILIVLAHPDDPEFFMGATIARWTAAGHTVHYCLLTRGDKGVRDAVTDPHELAMTRELEQRCAADALGVQDLLFLNFQDGYLIPDLDARKSVVRVIRTYQPDIVISSDPLYIFGENNINHPDHRAVGQIVVDAVFPAAGNPLYFHELMVEEGLMPHSINELWLCVTGQANVTIDVTECWERKIQALHCHVTQISDMNLLDERLRSRFTPDSSAEHPRYEERFRRFKFR